MINFHTGSVIGILVQSNQGRSSDPPLYDTVKPWYIVWVDINVRNTVIIFYHLGLNHIFQYETFKIKLLDEPSKINSNP